MSHAVLYVAASVGEAALPEEVRCAGVDVDHDVVAVFGIAEVRSLIDRVHRRPVASPYRSFVLGFRTITHEAQNALLKLLEEPPLTTRFFIVVPHESILLPTVRSRLALVSVTDTTGDEVAFAQFLKFTHAERLTRIAHHTKEKDEVWIETVKQGVLQWVTANKEVQVQSRIQMLHVATTIGTRGASNKMLLEALALLVPVEQS